MGWHEKYVTVKWNHLLYLLATINVASNDYSIFLEKRTAYDRKYGTFSEPDRLEMLEETKKMFTFAYDSYMKYAFPMDELNPIYCRGRGPDYENPSNININDVLGDYSLTLVDSLDTLAILGNVTEFKKAVRLVIDVVSFDKNNTIQVFEANIRLLGGLLSAHLLIKDDKQPFGDLVPDDYDDELLSLAHDLANRLLPAFDKSPTGLPYPRVNLKYGVPNDSITETCTAGVGSILLEFGILSRLLKDPIYENVARRAVKVLWKYRSSSTGLFGNVIDILTGSWVGNLSGLGAGLDSFYEYLLKSYIMFGSREDYEMFSKSYSDIKQYMRRGRPDCNVGDGDHPLYVNVNMNDGSIVSTWIDSLQAAFAGVQVLHGDMEEAICAHALYYAIWRRFDFLPERFNWQNKVADVVFYPLRPELAESTYLLYQASKNPFYRHVGRDIIRSLNDYARVECGYATVHNVHDKTLEDRMESFFLSETLKYLFLLFDDENPLNKEASSYIFSTEGHVFPLDWKKNNDDLDDYVVSDVNVNDDVPYGGSVVDARMRSNNSNCVKMSADRRYLLPLKSKYLAQIDKALGISIE